MNLTLKIVVDNGGEAALRSTRTLNQPALTQADIDAGKVKKTDADRTKADLEDYLTDRVIDTVNSYIKDYGGRVTAKSNESSTVVGLKRKLEAAPADVQAQVADLLKNVSRSDSGSASKGV